jgi:hypothetical protein
MEATIFTGWIYNYLNACLDPALMSLGQQHLALTGPTMWVAFFHKKDDSW